MRKRQALKITKNYFQAKSLIKNYKLSTSEASWKFFIKLNQSERSRYSVEWIFGCGRKLLELRQQPSLLTMRSFCQIKAAYAKIGATEFFRDIEIRYCEW
jgi:hypothetical protein